MYIFILQTEQLRLDKVSKFKGGTSSYRDIFAKVMAMGRRQILARVIGN